jgi:hypothetical protein
MISLWRGWKTYAVAAATVLYGVAEWSSGAMTQDQAFAFVFGGAGLAALRHGVSGSVITIAQEVLPALLNAMKDAKPAAKALLAAVIFSPFLLLTACATSTTDGTAAKVDPLVFAYQVACGTYSQAKAPLAVAVQLGVMDRAGQDALNESMAGIDQLCSAPTPPANLQDAVARINGAAAAVLLTVAQSHGIAVKAPVKS